MKNKKKIEDLFEQIEATADAIAAAEEKFKSSDKLVRSFFGLSNAPEKQLTDAIDQQRAYGEPVDFIEDAIKAKANAKNAIAQGNGQYERLVTDAETLVNAEAKPLIEAITVQEIEVQQKIKEAMEPYFESGAIETAKSTSHVINVLHRKRASLQHHNPLFPKWNAVQRIYTEVNQQEK